MVKSGLPRMRASRHSVSSRNADLKRSRRAELSIARVVRASSFGAAEKVEEEFWEGNKSSVWAEVSRVRFWHSRVSSPFLGT